MSDDGVEAFTEAAEAGAYEALVGERDNLVFQAIEASHDRLRTVGDANDYDVEPVIESLELVEADRSDGEIRWGWSHPAAEYFEFGTSAHTIDGDPILSFVWEDPPPGIREEFDQARDSGGRFQSGVRVFFSSVEVEGITETRFVRAGVEYLARQRNA